MPLLPGQADQVDHLAGIARVRVVAGVAGDGLADRQIGLDRDVLQHEPDPLTQRPAAGPVAGIGAEHFDAPGVSGAESLQDLQDGGLAGAVRAEQRENLPAGDGEAHPAHGLHSAITLPQSRRHDRASGRCSRPGDGLGGHVRRRGHLRTHRASTVMSR
jgi:hypothetical protein